jgi:hypothetical protein
MTLRRGWVSRSGSAMTKVHHLVALDLVVGAPENFDRSKRKRTPTLAGIAKQAGKAGIEVKQYEVKPDGSIIVVTGKSNEATEAQSDFDKWMEKHRAN